MDAADRILQLEGQLAYAEGLILSHRAVMSDWFYDPERWRPDASDKEAALFQRFGLELVKPMRVLQ